MKEVIVKLTIDQWMLPDLITAVGDLADSFEDKVLKSVDGYLLQPYTRSVLERGYLWDVYELLNDIDEQARNQ